jgi:tRNA-specific 2-thiouridylase
MRDIDLNITVAMSGGVDSSVAAALIKAEGHNVTGVTMRLWPVEELNNSHSQADSVVKAREVADKLGIPHHIIDLTDIFQKEIIDDFCQEYRRGLTPNPCVRCNHYIKFGALMDKVQEFGADRLATGHYARVVRDEKNGKYLLKKGADTPKDQSYFLSQLTQAQLSHTLFPLGGMTKDKVRQLAAEMELPATERPESQEICFIPNDDYAAFLEKHLPDAGEPGPITNQKGETLGEHRGIHAYTIGQRRGLGIAAAEPLYVTAIESGENTIVVGPRESIFSRELTASDVNWILGTAPDFPVTLQARIRYRHPEAEAILDLTDKETFHAVFKEPQMAVTPGQAVVFYDGENVIGSGIITKPGR